MNTASVRSCRDRLWRPANVTVTFIFHKPRRISLQAEDPAAASGSGQITTESGSIHSLVWLLTYSAFLLPHNTASTLSEPGQSLIRFGRVPGSENELISPAAPAVRCASACPRHQKTRAMRRCVRFFGRSLRTKSPLETSSALRLRWEYLEVSFNPRFGRDQIRRRAFRCGRFRQGVCGALKFLVVA